MKTSGLVSKQKSLTHWSLNMEHFCSLNKWHTLSFLILGMDSFEKLGREPIKKVIIFDCASDAVSICIHQILWDIVLPCFDALEQGIINSSSQ